MAKATSIRDSIKKFETDKSIVAAEAEKVGAMLWCSTKRHITSPWHTM